MSEENSDKKEISEKFVNSIKKWVDLDDKIKKCREEMKNYTNEKKEVETIILKELDKMDEKIINLKDGKLKKSVSKTQAPLKKENIHKSILTYLKDESKANELLDNMMQSRPTVERINLKRIINKNVIQ